MVTFDSHILSPAFAPNLPYKDSDLLNVMLVGRAPLAIACHPDRPYKTFAEAMADARQRPGKLEHRRARRQPGAAADDPPAERERLRRQPDLLQGRRPDGAGRFWPASPTWRSPRLASVEPAYPQPASCGRSPPPARSARRALPDTPTLGEQGIKAYPTYSWWGIYAPAGTPRPIVERMNAEIAKAVRSPDVAQKFVEQIDMEILASSPEAFAAFQKVEQERWFKVIKDNDIKAD